MYEISCSNRYIFYKALQLNTDVKQLSHLVILDIQFVNIHMENLNVIQYTENCFYCSFNDAGSTPAYIKLNDRISRQ
jgi:hypothetical protein